MLDRNYLIYLLRGYAYRTGEEFTLKSGGTSKEYVDVRRASHHPLIFQELGRHLLDAVERRCDWAVAGVAEGGILPAAALSQAALTVNAFMPQLTVRLKAKEHGGKNRIDGYIPDDLRGQRIGRRRLILVEDVVTTGNSVLEAIDALATEDLHVDHVIAVVDREMGGMERIQGNHNPHVYFTAKALVRLSELGACASKNTA